MRGKNAIIVEGYVNKVSSKLKMRPEAESVGTVNLSFFVVLFSRMFDTTNSHEAAWRLIFLHK